MYLIGLTGNIASGKSTVRRMLEQLGARTIDADALAHAVLLRGSPPWRAVAETFGPGVFHADGEVDRRKLGAIVFADPAQLQKLEAIVHPAVATQLALLLREAREPVVAVEAVKLVEAGLHQYCDAVWIVTTSAAEAKRRLMQDRTLSEMEAQLRLRAQPSLDEKLKLAQVVIDNSGSVQATRMQVTRAFAAIHPETATDKTTVLISLLGLPPPPPAPSASGEATEGRINPPPTDTSPQAGKAEGETGPAAIPSMTATPPAETGSTGPAQGNEVEGRIGGESISVRPARPSDLNLLANLLAHLEGARMPLSRSEVLRRFGKWGYWLAETNQLAVALAGWHAENLVAVIQDLWTVSPELAPRVFPPLLAAIEQKAQTLQCEVLALITNAKNNSLVQPTATEMGYGVCSLDELHPHWRSVVQSELGRSERLYIKRLRKEMVTKPI